MAVLNPSIVMVGGGIQGPQGPAGAAGASWWWGPDVPSVEAAVGDWYISGNGNVYEFSSARAWVYRTSLRGPVGPQGAAGAAGADSSVAGPQGPPGLTGPAGAQGPQGLPGPTGPAGAQGLVGAMGPAGPQGVPGVQGLKGDPGATGATGPVGATGLSMPGSPGPQGAVGPIGPVGAQGAQGLQGDPGWFRAKLPVDVVNSTVTLADVTSLGFAVAANSDYEFEFQVLFQSAALTTGVVLALAGPVSPVLLSWRCEIPISATSSALRYGSTYGVETVGTAVEQINVPRLATIQGVVRNGNTAGLVVARFRSEVAASAVVVRAGSLVRWQAF